MSKATEQKANTYLTEGRVGVSHVAEDGSLATIFVQGSELYQVVFAATLGWFCTCPARVACAHIFACKKILPHLKKTEISQLNKKADKELTEFLESH